MCFEVTQTASSMTLQFFINVTILALLFCSLNAFSGQIMPRGEFPPLYPPQTNINALYPQTLPPHMEFYWQQPSFYWQQQSGLYGQQHGNNMGIHSTHNPVMTGLALNNGPTSPQLTLAQAKADQQTNQLGLQDLYRCIMLKQIGERLARLTINPPPRKAPPSTGENSNGISREDNHAFKFDKIDIESTDPYEKPAAVFIASDREGNTIAFAGPKHPTGLKLAELLKEHCESFPEFGLNENILGEISSDRITPTQIQDSSAARAIIDLDDLMHEIRKKYPDIYTNLHP